MWLWSVDLPRTYMHKNPIKSKLYGMDICIYGYTDNCMYIHICGDWCGYVPLLYGYRFMIVDICLWIHIYVVTEMDMGLDESEWFVTIITPFPPFSWKSFWQGTSFSHLCWSYFPFPTCADSFLINFCWSYFHREREMLRCICVLCWSDLDALTSSTQNLQPWELFSCGSF